MQVARGGTKSWILRYKRAGKTRHLGLGPLAVVSLREARERAINARRLLLDEPLTNLDEELKGRIFSEAQSFINEFHPTVIFVTHSVEEAVVLSDRVVVMTAGPGRIEHDSRIHLARPREVSAIDFNQVRRDITQRLTSHVVVKSVSAAA